ncbi:MAG: hypothetical protein Mars2KO_41240 [Maribacter sp.]
MERNFIIHQEAKTYQWSGECYLSIKSFHKGKADYEVKQRAYVVDQKNYLILNECTAYRLTIDSRETTGSFCVFFSPEFVAEVVSEWNSSDRQMLDLNPKSYGGLRLFERNYPHQGPVSSLLHSGRTKSEAGMSLIEQDEYYLRLLNAILGQNYQSQKETYRLLAKKESTRKEIYRRILFVKDYIDANYREDLRLKDIATIGLLSENHLLRNFSRFFGATPFQYISQKRIQEAQQLLLQGETPIKDIAIQIGYTSMSNFSTYFKRMTGMSPSEFRKR